MCGRYALIQALRIADLIPGVRLPKEATAPRYNIAPGQPILAILNTPDRQARMVHWGLIPSWAKDRSMGAKMFNARAETLAEKPAFRDAFRRRRCLIFADGFYEWKHLSDGKTLEPMYIRMQSHEIFAFAGLWEEWTDPQSGELISSCTVITTAPNSLLEPIHDRMPVILPPHVYQDWLNPKEVIPESLAGLLVDYPAEFMETYCVSPAVNQVGREGPELINPVAPVSRLFEGLS